MYNIMFDIYIYTGKYHNSLVNIHHHKQLQIFSYDENLQDPSLSSFNNISINSISSVFIIRTVTSFKLKFCTFWPPSPISHIPPPTSPHPTATTACYLHVWVFIWLSYKYDHTVFLFYLTGIMPSRSIDVVIIGRIFIFVCLNITLCVLWHFLHPFIHHGPLDCFHVLAIVNNSTVNVEHRYLCHNVFL